MKLPNAELAIVDERKVREYLLSDSHPIGRFKAAFFRKVGFKPDNWRDLRAQLLEIAVSNDAELGAKTEFGQKYPIDGILRGTGGLSGQVTTVWIILRGQDIPRLVTVYPR